MSSKSGSSSQSPKKTRSSRAGLIFPVSRIHHAIREANTTRRIGVDAAVAMTAVVEYLSAEILELAAKAATDNGRKTISARHILLAIKNDEELDNMLKAAIISGGGVLPKINPTLLPRKVVKQHPEQDISSQEY